MTHGGVQCDAVIDGQADGKRVAARYKPPSTALTVRNVVLCIEISGAVSAGAAPVACVLFFVDTVVTSDNRILGDEDFIIIRSCKLRAKKYHCAYLEFIGGCTAVRDEIKFLLSTNGLGKGRVAEIVRERTKTPSSIWMMFRQEQYSFKSRNLYLSLRGA